MARIRTIKPEFWKNEKLGELSAEVQLLFIGLWNLADKKGFLEDRPKRIKAELFPYRDCDVDDLLNQLKGDFIDRIMIDDKPYLHIKNFVKHQVINVREPESTVPEQYWYSTGTVPAQWEGKGREGKGEGKAKLAHEVFPETGLNLDHEQTKQELSTSDQWKEDLMREYKIYSLEELNEMLSQFLKESNIDGKYPRKLSDTKNHFRNVLKSGKRFKPPEPEVSEEFKQRQKILMPTI